MYTKNMSQVALRGTAVRHNAIAGLAKELFSGGALARLCFEEIAYFAYCTFASPR